MNDDWQTDKLPRTYLRNGRATLGYLCGVITSRTRVSSWSGVADAAQEHDVNLICFVGGALRDAQGSAWPGNVLYDLINTQNLDGLVSWASTVGGSLTRDETLRFHQRFLDVPLVTMGVALEGLPSVAEGHQGVREAMLHLIEVHGYRRLGFVRGPESHPQAEARYNVYLDVLKEYGIPLDLNLVVSPGEWNKATGVAAARVLLDQRRLRPKFDLEVIVTASDLFALGVLEELHARGIGIPRDIAVVGINDSPECRMTRPPLTSVAMPLYERGRRAVEMLLARITK